MSNLDLQKLTDEQIAQIRAILNAENIKTTSEETINNGADENNNDKPLEDLYSQISCLWYSEGMGTRKRA